MTVRVGRRNEMMKRKGGAVRARFCILFCCIACATMLKGVELWDWPQVLESGRYDVNSSAGVAVSTADVADVGACVEARNTLSSDKSLYIGATFDIPYASECELSYWFGAQDGHGKNYDSVVLEGRAVFPGTQRWLYRLFVRSVPGASEAAVCDALSSGTVYPIETAVETNANCHVCSSAKCVVDDVKMVDGVRLFHYRLSLSDFMEAPRTVLYLSSCYYVGMPSQSALILGGVSLTAENDTTHEPRELYAGGYELPNRIRDSVEGKSADLLMSGAFSMARNGLSHQPYFDTAYRVTPVEKTISDPRSGAFIQMRGHCLRSVNGEALPFFVSGSQLNPVFKVINTGYANESYRYEEDRNYALQFWVDTSELEGNSLTRVLGYSPLRVNTSNEPTGRKFMFSDDNDYMSYVQNETMLKIVDRIGDMVCLRAYATTNKAERLWRDFTFSIYSCSGRPVTQVSIYNLTLIESPYIDPYHDYKSESEVTGSRLRGKRVLFVGDSQYNNGILGTALERTLGCFSYDMHYGGHRVSIPGNYSTATQVNKTSHSWFYQEDYRRAVLTQPTQDVVILTMSTNDGGGDSNWTGAIDEARIDAVKAAYPTFADMQASGAADRDEKLQRFNAMTDAERAQLFTFVPTYCAYVEQVREAYPNARIYLCTVPISCSGMLTGTAVPDPAEVSQEIGEWRPGYDRFVARRQLEAGSKRLDAQIRAIAKRYGLELIDLRTESGLTYDNFIYHCTDGTHWHRDISHRCAESIIRALRGYDHKVEPPRSSLYDYDIDGAGSFSFLTTLGEYYTGADYLSVSLDGRRLYRANYSSMNWVRHAFSTSEAGPHRVSLRCDFGHGSTNRAFQISDWTWEPRESGAEPTLTWSCVTNADETVTVTGVEPQPQYELTLPSQLYGRTVSSYANGVFWENAQLTRVAIPESVDIAPLCFRACASAELCVEKSRETVAANGLPVRVFSNGHDITDCLDIPAEKNGVVEVSAARVRQAVADDALDFSRAETPAAFRVGEDRPLKTAPTVPGLTYTLLEGASPTELEAGAQVSGDGEPWEPEVTVTGAQGFFRVRVDK